MSRALFVSDIHISSTEDPKCALFLRLLDTCIKQKVGSLFLVGDIFDLWVADRRYFVEAYQPVIEKIRQLVAAGVSVHYFEGNHDLDLRPFWQHNVGVTVHSQAALFTLNGKQVRVEHGDQMDPDDRGYLFLRWLLRTPIMVAMGRYLPNFLVRWIGRRASLTSRDYTSQVKVSTDAQAREKIRTHVRRVFAGGPMDLLISGHVHVSEDSVVDIGGQSVRCINLGTWLKEPLVFDLQEKSAELKRLEEI